MGKGVNGVRYGQGNEIELYALLPYYKSCGHIANFGTLDQCYNCQ